MVLTPDPPQANDTPTKVLKVEFNAMGSALAAVTDGNLLQVWKPDFVGKWLLVSAIAGSPNAIEEDE